MSVGPFLFSSQLPRVVFGVGSIAFLQREIDLLGASKAIVLSTPEQRDSAELVSSILGRRCAGIFDRATMHVPIDIARQARTFAASAGADCIVAIGGGSTTGLGKAIALESAIPILAIPTTYAGSEMTAIYGVTENGLKRTGRDPCVRPRTVIYDPELTLTLPIELSVTSGMNAMAHAVEAMYAEDANPVMSLIAEEAIRAMSSGLRSMHGHPHDLDARSDCLYGAWLCGVVLGSVGIALHHKLCHTLGGSYNLPHAQTHAVVLPHVIAYNTPAVPETMARIARALQADDAARGFFDLARCLGAPTALKDLGMPAEELDRCAQIATEHAYWNPRPVNREQIRRLLEAAYHGMAPA